MFDNLRDDASFYEEEQAQFQSAAGTEFDAPRRSGSSRFLGMTSIQRFVLAFMLMLAVCVIGALCLLVTGKILL
ncbi:MAG: hypothetical protein Q8L87_20375 [Anaerolineales bacterium]|jgi:hypothetical protein|nr:hypothetical protein [Anaerolineales bacterium]